MNAGVGDLEKWIATVLLLVVSLLGSGCASQGGSVEGAEALVKQSTLIDGFLVAGEQLYNSNNLELAQAQFQRVLELDTVNIRALYRLGNIHFKVKELDKALAYYNKVIALNPRHSKAHFNVAVVNMMRAQGHFTLYRATAEADLDTTRVGVLLESIKAFSAPKKAKKESRLNELYQALENQK